MNKTTFLIAFSIIVISIGFSQSYEDVVYLKNGDVAKGVIVENAPNNYIKLEMENGSILTFKYEDIQKFTKERIVEDPITIQPKQYKQQTKSYKKSTVDKNQNNSFFDDKIHIFAYGGLFAPNDESFKDVYGSGVIGGLGVKRRFANQFASQISIGYFNKKGDPEVYASEGVDVSGDASIQIIPMVFSILYYLPSEGFYPYLGIGSNYEIMEESIELTSSIGNASGSGQWKAWGFHVVIGVEMNQNSSMSYGLEMRFSTTEVTSEWGDTVNLGGITLVGVVTF